MKIKFSVHPKKHPRLEAAKARRKQMKECSNAAERKALRKARAFNRGHSGSF